MEQQAMQNLSQICGSTSAEFSSLIDEMNKLSLYASTNRTVMDVFMNDNSSGSSETIIDTDIYLLLNSLSTPNSSNRFRITLYSQNGLFFSTGLAYNRQYVSQKLESDSYKEWFNSLPIRQNHYSLSAFHKDHWTDSDTAYLSLFRQIFDPYRITDSNGIVEIQCPYQEVRNLFRFQNGQYSGLLMDMEGNILLSTSKDTDAPEGFTAQNALPESTQGKFGKMLYHSNVLENQFRIVITQSRSHIWNVILPQIVLIVLMGITVLFLILSVLFRITKQSTEPLRELTATIKQVSADTPSLHLNNLDYPDEIYSLNQAFGQMFDRINAFHDEIIAMKTSEMRAHMIALQAQMNPHFLYNMLSVMKIMSQEGNNSGIESACDYLVKMLRYTAAYEQADVTLREELAHVSCYLSLMKMRYEDYLEYTILTESDDSAINFIIPKLTLLPLLENSFKHGFQASSPPWIISVACETDSHLHRITITDNGCGISAQKQATIEEGLKELLRTPNKKIASLTFGGTGLINTLARLTLKFKEDFHYEISQPSEGGTKIILEVKQL